MMLERWNLDHLTVSRALNTIVQFLWTYQAYLRCTFLFLGKGNRLTKFVMMLDWWLYTRARQLNSVFLHLCLYTSWWVLSLYQTDNDMWCTMMVGPTPVRSCQGQICLQARTTASRWHVTYEGPQHLELGVCSHLTLENLKVAPLLMVVARQGDIYQVESPEKATFMKLPHALWDVQLQSIHPKKTLLSIEN